MSRKSSEVITDLVQRIRSDKNILVKLLLILCAGIYVYFIPFSKHGDFWQLTYMAKYFSQYGFEYSNYTAIYYPSLIFPLQGIWLQIGSMIFNFHLADWTWETGIANNPTALQAWAMIPIVVCLFAFTALAYLKLRNKWLTLLCFSSLTFVSVMVMGQIDIFSAFLLFAATLLMVDVFKNKRGIEGVFYSAILLGLSADFKPFAGFVIPIFILYSIYIFMKKGYDWIKVGLLTAGTAGLTGITFIILFLLQGKHNFSTISGGESSWIFSTIIAPINLPPYHNIAIWLLGYLIVLYFAYQTLFVSKKAVNLENSYVIYNFIAIAWMFITIYTHPQWWAMLVPFVIFLLEVLQKRRHYWFALALAVIYMFYPMMWLNNIDGYLRQYLPIVPIDGMYATIVPTILVALLVVWIIDLVKYPEADSGHEKQSGQYTSYMPVLILVIPFVFVILFVGAYLFATSAVTGANNGYSTGPIPEIYGDTTVGETFVATYSNLDEIDLLIGTYARQNHGKMIFHLRENISAQDITTVTFDTDHLIDNQYYAIKFPPIPNSAGQKYYFYLESPDSAPGNALAIYHSTLNAYIRGDEYIDNKQTGGDLAFKTFYKPDLYTIMPFLDNRNSYRYM